MMQFLFESSICLALFVSLYHLMLRNEPMYVMNRGYLLGAMAVSLIIPVLAIPVYPAEVQNTTQQIIAIDRGGASLTFVQMITWIYLAGVVVMSLRYLRILINVFTLTRDVRFKISQPFSFFRLVYIPEDITGEGRDIILAHEKVHMRHGHSYDVLFSEIFAIAFWFNPFVYLLKKYLREVHEYTADQLTCQTLHLQATTYLDLIGTIAVRPGIEPSTQLNTFASFIKKRILMLTNNNKGNVWKYFTTLPAVTLMLVMFSFCTSKNNASAVAGPSQQIIDTIIVFDPNTYEEKVFIVERPVDKNVKGNEGPISTTLDNENEEYSIDTIVVYDPGTGKEKHTVVRVKKKKD